ncbi:hypothetical protein WJX79_002756 [Trebouxia sp. C0005]
MSLRGEDSDGKKYSKPEALWSELAQAPEGAQEAWYNRAVAYWDSQEASVNGVLGGYGHVSDDDITESRKFLFKALGKTGQGVLGGCAADCGAGVGRVSQNLLLHHFQEVDVVEPSHHYIESARKALSGSSAQSWPSQHKAVNFYKVGLENWTPHSERYDVIWIQWALLYLTDDDAVAFFDRCKAGLKRGGVIVVKENICKHTEFVVDKEDSSLTRSNKYMLQLFAKSKMLVMYNVLQRNFPKELFPVRMYAIKPRTVTADLSQK